MKNDFGIKDPATGKPKHILTIIGLIAVVVGVVIVIISLNSGNGKDNSLVFEKQVEAQIIDAKVNEYHTGSYKKKNAVGWTEGHTEYLYEIVFEVYDGTETYTENQTVSKPLYDEYLTFERNKTMTFNLYVNADGNKFLSQGDEKAANEEYHNAGYMTKARLYKMIVGAALVFVGMIILGVSSNIRKKRKYLS